MDIAVPTAPADVLPTKPITPKNIILSAVLYEIGRLKSLESPTPVFFYAWGPQNEIAIIILSLYPELKSDSNHSIELNFQPKLSTIRISKPQGPPIFSIELMVTEAEELTFSIHK